ncbi:MAG TPA: winged helix-turn-helix domain-containing protein [Candidatus Obscuribacterales bacterium]
MGRILELVNHLSSEALQQRYRNATDPVELRRWHLLWLISQHWYVKDAAATVGLNYDYARAIVHRYNREGTTSVSNRRRGHQRPRRALLNPAQQQELEQVLQTPPSDGGLWSSRKVADWIVQRTGRSEVRAQRGWDYLQRLERSLQSPRPQHVQADLAAQAAFKKTSPPV